ncbi:MAG: type II toxin-antitoxin system HicB family antitoxin [Gammaproteobacteria bacterium]|nr:type II toxin-antitoxin system HicB family antitoxin [Gammaproteobacteria bacterium]
MPYVAFIHHELNTGYGISFPDVPGCVSIGDTLEEAIRHGCEALAFHLDGLISDGESVPSPRSIEEVKADDSLVDWRSGADIVLVPALSDRG